MQTAPLLAATAAAALFVSAQTATAQYVSDFESLTASAAGTILTGQDGYYIPAGTTSVDFTAFTYAGNTLAVPANPNGGANFIAGDGPAGGAFARAQRDMSYTGNCGTWTAGFDILGQYNGTLPTAQNLGSFSIQPFPGSQSYIALARWADVTTAAAWNADYVYFDAAGTQITGSVANTAFQNLPVNTWYRWETDFDLNTNQIVEIRLTDIVAGTTVTDNPVGWYMLGGAAGSLPPTGFRFFAGGGIAGNTLAFDNPGVTRIDATDILYYKFEGGCGDRVVNYATSGIAPSVGIIESTSASSPWTAGQTGGGLAGGSNQAPQFYNRVDSGWDGAFSGDFTVAWWMKQASTPGTTLSYFYSGVGSFRCFTNGVAGVGLSTRSWGGGDLVLTTDIQVLAAAGWTHVALVVDGTALTGTYYVDGVAQAPIAIANGASVAASTNNFRVGMHTSTTTPSAYDLDEFVFANRAYTPTEIAALHGTNRAAQGSYGAGCNGTSSMFACETPSIGNSAYALTVLGPPNTMYAIGFGTSRCTFGPYTLPLDLGMFFAPLAGCLLEDNQDLSVFPGGTGATGRGIQPCPIPPVPSLDGANLYGQALIVDVTSGMIEMTNAWAINIGQ